MNISTKAQEVLASADLARLEAFQNWILAYSLGIINEEQFRELCRTK